MSKQNDKMANLKGENKMDIERTCKDGNEYGCMNYPFKCDGCIHSKNNTVLSSRHDDNFKSKRAGEEK